jgi:hypothetical protein
MAAGHNLQHLPTLWSQAHLVLLAHRLGIGENLQQTSGVVMPTLRKSLLCCGHTDFSIHGIVDDALTEFYNVTL